MLFIAFYFKSSFGTHTPLEYNNIQRLRCAAISVSNFDRGLGTRAVIMSTKEEEEVVTQQKDEKRVADTSVQPSQGSTSAAVKEEIEAELILEQVLEDQEKELMKESRNKGLHKYRESKTSIDEGTFAVFNRFRDKSKLPLQKMVGKKIYDGLHKLVKDGEIKKVRKLLNKVSHPPVDLRTEKEFFNRTALHIACICGHQEAVQLLLGHKANKNLKDNWGWTPIMYAASYGHVNIVKELIGRGANISLQNKKGQFLIDIIRAKRDEFEWRDELAYFVEQTEDELTSQIFADGIQGSFGRILHFTRPKPRYRNATVTLPLKEVHVYIEHRNGDFGFRQCKRVYHLKDISGIRAVPESNDSSIEFCLEKASVEEVYLEDRPNNPVEQLREDKDKISKTDLEQVINICIDVPSNLHASWMVRYLKKRALNHEKDSELFAKERKNSKLSKVSRVLKNALKFANISRKRNRK